MVVNNIFIDLIWDFLNSAVPIILAIGVIIGFYHYKNIQKHIKLLLWYFVFALVTDISHRILPYNTTASFTLFLIPFFGLIELILFSRIYHKHLLKKKYLLHKFVTGAVYILLLYEFIFSFITKDPKSFYSYGKIAVNLYIITTCILYYKKLFESLRISESYRFILFNSGVLAYFTFNLLINISINFLVNENLNIVIYFWIANALITLMFYAFNTFLIWKDGRIQKPLQSGLPW